MRFEAMSGGIDLVVLDLGLPDMDGLDVARGSATGPTSCRSWS